jgi:hypothetical protein
MLGRLHSKVLTGLILDKTLVLEGESGLERNLLVAVPAVQEDLEGVVPVRQKKAQVPMAEIKVQVVLDFIQAAEVWEAGELAEVQVVVDLVAQVQSGNPH